MVPTRLLEYCPDSTAIHLFAVLWRFSNQERRAFPGQERLAREMGVSVRTMQRGLELLKKCGAVSTEPRRENGFIVGTEYLIRGVKSYVPLLARSSKVSQDEPQDVVAEPVADHKPTRQSYTTPVSPITRGTELDRSRELHPAEIGDAVDRAIAHWRGGWKAHYGHENSLIQNPIEIADLGRQIATLGEPAVLEAIDAYFATTEPYPAQVQHALRVFAKDPNRWRAKAKPITPRSGNERRQQTRDANATHVADGRLSRQLQEDYPEQFKS